ncbi:MAG: hypothetical protein GW839_04605 [Flavobacteriales bacterium]|nr:hypothetical protein [Flavobacteriia bacterium]NCP06147.1 hypothetical protein [Flavobacteriales bacterium]PIV93749.1 MAG: hypothetical protein COW44_07885 [Flavobacteriaceae bacterium CG17_big_fil_post_rev_8_21_14_2_50_33_15]PIY11195.1 MAG: hypothetical protein COZ17_07500 [Flavobacteriaceae bacterium CG_4_10_14_3_um_filter_33_47]PJB17455.1 MAG: hypothetical protein CO117_11650 [Flavobacteriaceae bacterium CG_4_9_14_3_um_filter_33_16]
MIKRPMLLVFMVAIVFGNMLTVKAQDDSKDYKMWEDIMLTPDNTKLKVLQENMRKHNATYHKEGPTKATVYNIVSGPNSGNIIWEMGPMMFKHNDVRPGEGGHDADWRDNVMPYIKKVQTIEYWTADKKLNNTDMMTKMSQFPISFIRYYEVIDGPAPGVNTFFERISKTVKALDGVNPWGVYYNEFRQGNLGRHIATFSFSPNWTDFERDVNWVENFNKVNGENSWQNQQDLYQATFKNTWDEIWVYNPQMSGD